MRLLISRTDNLGDVVLTLPFAGWLKAELPDVRLGFLGKPYTQPLLKRSGAIDEIVLAGASNDWTAPAWDAIIHVFPNKKIAGEAKKAGIPIRIGTSHRLFHWFTCTRLVNLGRKNSILHEAELNLRLARPLGLTSFPAKEILPEYYHWLTDPDFRRLPPGFSSQQFNLIIHPKSKGSAKEWPIARYLDVINNLPAKEVTVWISGTGEDGKWLHQYHPEIFDPAQVRDLTGYYSLGEFISFIEHADGLLACSTGPLHIAAAAGIATLGLYPSQRPMHAGRWGPLGKKAYFLEELGLHKKSNQLQIDTGRVIKLITSWLN